MNGVLIIDKPENLTSHDVIWHVRRILQQKSVGHTGTLDPFATGVLVILLGKATRLAQFLDKAEKEYLATIRFGFETDTGDRTGSPKFEVQSQKSFSVDGIKAILDKFSGEIWQTPPMYSAKKIAGKKLYEMARKGVEIERQPLKVIIHKLELEKIFEEQSEIVVRVAVSAGTYIRVLAEDIGKELGIGAHLAELRRIRAGAFDLRQAITLDELKNLASENQLERALITPNQALAHLPVIVLEAETVKKITNGNKLFSSMEFRNGQFVRMCDDQNKLVAVGTAEGDFLQPKVVLLPD